MLPSHPVERPLAKQSMLAAHLQAVVVAHEHWHAMGGILQAFCRICHVQLRRGRGAGGGAVGFGPRFVAGQWLTTGPCELIAKLLIRCPPQPA